MLAQLTEQFAKPAGWIERLLIAEEERINKTFHGRKDTRMVFFFENRRKKPRVGFKFGRQSLREQIRRRAGIGAGRFQTETIKGVFEQKPGTERFYGEI